MIHIGSPCVIPSKLRKDTHKKDLTKLSLSVHLSSPEGNEKEVFSLNSSRYRLPAPTLYLCKLLNLHPLHPSPIGHGWELVDGYCHPVRHTHPANLPTLRLEIAEKSEHEKADEEQEE